MCVYVCRYIAFVHAYICACARIHTCVYYFYVYVFMYACINSILIKQSLSQSFYSLFLNCTGNIVINCCCSITKDVCQGYGHKKILRTINTRYGESTAITCISI